MKQRILEFLAEETGYITFAMDVDLGRIAAINNYILHEEGSDENIARQTKVNKGYSWSSVRVFRDNRYEKMKMIRWF